MVFAVCNPKAYECRAQVRCPQTKQGPRGPDACGFLDLMEGVFAGELGLTGTLHAKQKKKWLVQGPRSFFMDVKCPGCFNITTVYSHAQTVVLCGSCSTVLCQPSGGKAKLVEGMSLLYTYTQAISVLSTILSGCESMKDSLWMRKQ